MTRFHFFYGGEHEAHRGHGRHRHGGRRGHMGDFEGFAAARAFGGSRVRRGFIRIALLKLLAEAPRHGYELIQTFKERGWGAAGPGSIYPLLMAMAEHGFVTSSEHDGKRVYTITDEGREFFQEHEARFTDLFEAHASEDAHDDVRDSMQRLAQAVMQAARSSNEQTVAATREILDRARKEIYGILAQE